MSVISVPWFAVGVIMLFKELKHNVMYTVTLRMTDKRLKESSVCVMWIEGSKNVCALSYCSCYTLM